LQVYKGNWTVLMRGIVKNPKGIYRMDRIQGETTKHTNTTKFVGRMIIWQNIFKLNL
jgi:hypothetical protein